MGHFSRNNELGYDDREDKKLQIKFRLIDSICKLNPNESKAKLERESIEVLRGKLGYLARTQKNNNTATEENNVVYDDFAFEERDYSEDLEDINGYGR